jgi:hypothetical protein
LNSEEENEEKPRDDTSKSCLRGKNGNGEMIKAKQR